MTDPYKILGINPDATDEQVKSAYRELAKKYHPDNYSNNPLSDLAQEKMQEVNEAYDAVMEQRRGGNSGGGYRNYGGSGSFSDIRRLIQSGRINDAEQLLDGMPEVSRDAEWHFLKGSVLYKKGFLENAYSHFERACNLDPNNFEYRQALGQMNNRRGGYNGQYRTHGGGGGCSGCDICSSLICADCCCECMGGDLIACC